MATGPKTGFIEVVRNAKTIAEVGNTGVVLLYLGFYPSICCLSILPSVQVSGTNDSKKLFEWIKSQQLKSVMD